MHDSLVAYYYKHPDLWLPEDASTIWRYMDSWKFMKMLEQGSIFFSRADRQTDNLEGEYPEGLAAHLPRRFPGRIRSDDGQSYTLLEWHTQRERPSRLLSCWSLGPTDTRRRWTAYTKNPQESIAVRSAVGRLKGCFHDRVEPVVWIGKVRYGEEENPLPNPISKWRGNYWLYPFFGKKEEYRWEDEVRATVNIALVRQAEFGGNADGCYVKADLRILIDSVWINPQLPDQVRQQVRACLNAFGLGSVGIHQSRRHCLP